MSNEIPIGWYVRRCLLRIEIITLSQRVSGEQVLPLLQVCCCMLIEGNNSQTGVSMANNQRDDCQSVDGVCRGSNSPEEGGIPVPRKHVGSMYLFAILNKCVLIYHPTCISLVSMRSFFHLPFQVYMRKQL